jgi:hypothetical protein
MIYSIVAKISTDVVYDTLGHGLDQLASFAFNGIAGCLERVVATSSLAAAEWRSHVASISTTKRCLSRCFSL